MLEGLYIIRPGNASGSSRRSWKMVLRDVWNSGEETSRNILETRSADAFLQVSLSHC